MIISLLLAVFYRPSLPWEVLNKYQSYPDSSSCICFTLCPPRPVSEFIRLILFRSLHLNFPCATPATPIADYRSGPFVFKCSLCLPHNDGPFSILPSCALPALRQLGPPYTSATFTARPLRWPICTNFTARLLTVAVRVGTSLSIYNLRLSAAARRGARSKALLSSEWPSEDLSGLAVTRGS